MVQAYQWGQIFLSANWPIKEPFYSKWCFEVKKKICYEVCFSTIQHSLVPTSPWNQLSTCSRERKGEINQHLISYKSWNQLSMELASVEPACMESSISINGKTQTKHFDRQTLVFFPPMMHRPLSPRPGKRHCSKKHKRKNLGKRQKKGK